MSIRPEAIQQLQDEVQRLIDRVDELKAGACRFHCRTAKENWIEGYLHAARVDDDYSHMGSEAMLRMAKGDYDDWKRQQTKDT